MRHKFLLLFVTCLAPAQAGDHYKGGVIVDGIGAAFDAGTSIGRPELNPLLRGQSQTFGARGVALKAGIFGGRLLVERFLLRRHPNWRGFAATAHYATGGASIASGVRNVRNR